ncbi:MAG: ABC transporter permease [Candidatus Azambacteria bacterium]|nr:ABC transporter permease [Candidatus Azambacteria bacterium]
MRIRYLAKTALRGLTTNKSRSFLTLLGIVIGIMAIILVMSLGQGAQNLILNQIQSIGPKVIAVVPGRQPKGPTDILSTFTDSLKEKDVRELQKKINVPHLKEIMPIVFGSQTAAYQDETYRPTILGVNNLFTKIYDIYPAEGRVFTDEEIKGYADVVIIGSKVKNELFGENNEDALNQKIKIKGRNFRIIGIFPQKGQVSFLNFDDVAIVPYTTAQQYIFGKKYFDRLVVEADDEKNVAQTVEDIKITLRNSHNISDPEKDDFFVETQAQAIETVGTITSTLTLFLMAIAAISLVVGGIGIMNIMLVSVTERTREIGLRKALGAKSKDILTQFLLEAIILTGVGGAIGIFLGILFSFIISFVLGRYLGVDWGFVIPFNAIFLGLGVSTLIGLVFGIYPARKASKKSPMEALRYE